MPAVAVVTDSTCSLPPDEAAALGVDVVPLRVLIGSRAAVAVSAVSSVEVVAALRAHQTVSTSRPTPAEFAAAYRRLLDAGASAVVSVHLSAALSGTWEAATLAAQEFPFGTVRVVDSRSTAMALGYAVRAAALAAADGAFAAQVQEAATACVDRTRTLFALDTLEYLRRGGRIGPAASLLAGSLAIRPLLQVVGGQVVPLERVRTTARALDRLVTLTVAEAAAGSSVSLAVQHLGAAERAATVADAVLAQLGDAVRESRVAELGPVLGAHLGPGVVGTVIVRH